MRRAVTLVSALSLCLGVGLAAPAQARPDWTPVGSLATVNGDMSGIELAVNERGDGVLAYSVDGGSIWVSLRKAGQPWGKPRKITTGPSAYEPQVGIAGDGRSIVLWSESSGPASWLRTTTFSPGGTQGPIGNLTLPGGSADSPVLAVNPAGRLAISWRDENATRVYGTTGVLSAIPAGTALDAAGGVAVYQPGVAIDNAGNVVFVWEKDFPDRYQVESRVRPAGGVLQATTVIEGETTDERAEYPDLSMTPQGEAVVVFGYRATTASSQGVAYAVRPVTGGFGTGSWSPSGAASAPGQSTLNSSMSVIATGAGRAVVSYLVAGALWVGTRDGGGFGSHQQLTGPGETTSDQRLRSRAGVVVAPFAGQTGSTTLIKAALRRLGQSTFGGTATLHVGPDSSEVRADVDGQGNVYLASVALRCLDSGCTTYSSSLRHVEFDAAAPTIAKLTKPKKPTVGKKAKFAVVATDRVSAIKVVWKFGDGKKGRGAKVKHKYATPGKKKVTVTVTDAEGNTTVKKFKVRVRPES